MITKKEIIPILALKAIRHISQCQAREHAGFRAMCPCLLSLSLCQHLLIVLSEFSNLVACHYHGTEALMSGIVI